MKRLQAGGKHGARNGRDISHNRNSAIKKPQPATLLKAKHIAARLLPLGPARTQPGDTPKDSAWFFPSASAGNLRYARNGPDHIGQLLTEPRALLVEPHAEAKHHEK